VYVKMHVQSDFQESQSYLQYLSRNSSKPLNVNVSTDLK